MDVDADDDDDDDPLHYVRIVFTFFLQFKNTLSGNTYLSESIFRNPNESLIRLYAAPCWISNAIAITYITTLY